jgi:hypothetical protein
MLRLLANRAYRHLFAAQVIALLGTGLATVAHGLLAYDLAGADAGVVLGTALAIKMVAYVGLAPIADAKRALIHDHLDHCLDADHSPADRDELKTISRYL